MNKKNPFLGNFETVEEEFKKIQNYQNNLVSKFLDNGIELQKKQYELFTNILQNQLELSSSLISGTLNIFNDNVRGLSKEKKK